MSKEDILEAVALGHYSLEQILDELFSQNICIPKGTNRHPYADVLHEWVEGTEIEHLSRKTNTWNETLSCKNVFIDLEYRIKSPDPVYEYLWMDLRTPDTYDYPTRKYMTIEEASIYFHKSKTHFKVNETKRVRQ